ncbi:MAG: DMT family transporter [Gammaproteobacteria bacterium]|nr:DMT family transporter [Gammaproteobacteria bacterium]
MRKKEKFLGYIIRLFAVIIWGIQPIYIKYTAINTVSMDYRIFFIAVGGLLISLISLLFFWKQKSHWNFKLKLNTLFFMIVITQLLFIYFFNISLRYTSSTNLIIFNNFAPLLALLVALVLWRKEIPYFKDRSHILAIIFVFFMGVMGSSLLFYNDIIYGQNGSIKGNILALLVMSIDVVLVISQIRYVKYLHDHQSIFLTLYIYLFIFMIMIPIVLINVSLFYTLTHEQIYYAIGAGVLSGIGQILNYEAFRRMDGFIAFLMFNIAILITFVIEAYWLKEIQVTLFLVVGGCFIISASIFAEVINTQCEKEALEK